MQLVALAAFCGPPGSAPSSVEIVDVNNQRVPGSEAAKDRPICLLEARHGGDARFIARLWKSYGPVFQFSAWNNFGPDSSFRQIRLTHEGKTLTLSSWHPIYERNGTAVVMSYGVTSLDGRSRTEMLRSDKPDYVARRAAFDSIVEQCVSRAKKKKVKIQ